MRNPIVKTVAGLIKQTNDAIAGLVAYAITLNLLAVPVAVLTAALNAFIASKNTVLSERLELAKRQQTLRGAMSSAMEVVGVARDVLKTHLGKKHSAAWADAGFLTSLAVPRRLDEMLSLLSTLATHLTAHPEHESADLNVIAARVTTVLTDLTAARNAVNAQKTTVANAMAARETNANTIYGLLRTLLAELAGKLDPMDNRYITFGFNKPGQLLMPDMPTGVIAVLIGANAIAVKWNKAARASHYRVWKKVIGVDAELLPVGSPADLDFALEGLPAGATVELAVSAVNNGGESAVTEVVTITTAA